MKITRREFLHRVQVAMAAAAVTPLVDLKTPAAASDILPVVSIVRRQAGDTARAVREAIDLLGGVEAVTENKTSIMLKPNLVSNAATDTTDPAVVRALAEILIEAGKEVCIGEGSAAASGFNVIDGESFRAHDTDLLERMQRFVFDELGYTQLAEDLDIPLVNLHIGELVPVTVPDAFVFETLMLHPLLTEIDLLVSVPRMKTHSLATVTLGLKNLIGLYAGSEYGTVRGYVHDLGAAYADVGTAIEIVDMARANSLGLTVIDGLVAMEGAGPSLGPDSRLVDMDLIIAGTNPLATDMVAASVMGFGLDEVPTFEWAVRAGMTPANLETIEVRGEAIVDVQRVFWKPDVVPWQTLTQYWGNRDLD